MKTLYVRLHQTTQAQAAPGRSAMHSAPACFRRDQSLITRRVTNMQCNRRMRRPRLCRSQQQVLHEYG